MKKPAKTPKRTVEEPETTVRSFRLNVALLKRFDKFADGQRRTTVSELQIAMENHMKGAA